MSRRKTFVFGLAAYFVIYVSLLVPGHLSQFSSDYSKLTSGYQQTQPECSHHDSSTCQICLTGGHISAVWTTYSADVNFDLIAPVIFESSARSDCFHVDRISARAPPFLV